jgi:hypothetical protein
MPTIQIKHRYTDAVLYEHETTDARQSSGLAMRDALEAASKAGANLSDAYLSGANLSDANLIGANLSDANLRGANLSDANLRGANLIGANLIGANLIGANLSNANLRGANLIDAYLSDANLRGANLSGANLSGANLRGANLSGANLRGAAWAPGVLISRAPLQLYGLTWPVTVLDSHMQIGCQLHSLHEWELLDDAAINAMDGRDALRFWRMHKSTLLALARADGRSFEPATATQEVAPC